jgi:GNAT superfamily N-acetyltransferase
MRLSELKYLLVREAAAGDGVIAGFASFMPTVEDGREVVYVYEIHLGETLRGSGLGRRLMGVVEHCAREMGVERVMLTSFTRNRAARRFYERLGYGRDEFSPMPKELRDGTRVEPGYVIMSKAVEGEGP